MEKPEWDNKYNSHLTTIKNRQFISGWLQGFIAAIIIFSLFILTKSNGLI